ncbi:hypothetical protein [Halocatena halophila]|uniref:hypothetical protein n=1 Tax=Halocatena halophila TaxID=2814576 RepID=UPI002ED1DF5E
MSVAASMTDGEPVMADNRIECSERALKRAMWPQRLIHRIAHRLNVVATQFVYG